MTDIWPDRFTLKDKVVVVTGGAGLIGRHICRACGQAGGKVFIAESDTEKGKKLQRDMMEDKLLSEYLYMDITSEESIKSGMEQILSKEGRIDVWVNNAYPRTDDWGNTFENIRTASWRKNVDMHLNGYFMCCQKVFEVMKEQRNGSIINFGSIYGVVGPDFSVYGSTEITMPAAYSAIKGGIISFTRYLAAYGGPYNVRVNAVCPGGVFDHQDRSFVDEYSRKTPLSRMAYPDEIAGPVLFLASDAASYITGHILMVDGGWTAC